MWARALDPKTIYKMHKERLQTLIELYFAQIFKTFMLHPFYEFVFCALFILSILKLLQSLLSKKKYIHIILTTIVNLLYKKNYM